jgi:hypothetical protein
MGCAILARSFLGRFLGLGLQPAPLGSHSKGKPSGGPVITAPTTLGAIFAFVLIFAGALLWATRPPAGPGHAHGEETDSGAPGKIS